MNTGTKLPVTGLMLTLPLAAHAQSIPHIATLTTFGGSFAGGFAGAMLACWLYKRCTKKDTDSKR